MSQTWRKIPRFHLISWCGNFGEPHTFLSENCAFLQNFHTRKLCENFVFCTVYQGGNNPISPRFSAMKTNNPISLAVTISLAA